MISLEVNRMLLIALSSCVSRYRGGREVETAHSVGHRFVEPRAWKVSAGFPLADNRRWRPPRSCCRCCLITLLCLRDCVTCLEVDRGKLARCLNVECQRGGLGLCWD